MITRRTLIAHMPVAAIMVAIGAAASCGPTPAPAIEFPHDPMLDLLTRYRAQLDHFDRVYGLDDETRETLMDTTWGPLWKEAVDNPPLVTTEAGALAAIREAIAEIDGPCFETSVLTAALAYFEGRTAS